MALDYGTVCFTSKIVHHDRRTANTSSFRAPICHYHTFFGIWCIFCHYQLFCQHGELLLVLSFPSLLFFSQIPFFFSPIHFVANPSSLTFFFLNTFIFSSSSPLSLSYTHARARATQVLQLPLLGRTFSVLGHYCILHFVHTIFFHQ